MNMMQILLPILPLHYSEICMDKTEGVLKNFLKKGQKGQSMDS